eukprot:315958_1
MRQKNKNLNKTAHNARQNKKMKNKKPNKNEKSNKKLNHWSKKSEEQKQEATQNKYEMSTSTLQFMINQPFYQPKDNKFDETLKHELFKKVLKFRITDTNNCPLKLKLLQNFAFLFPLFRLTKKK